MAHFTPSKRAHRGGLLAASGLAEHMRQKAAAPLGDSITHPVLAREVVAARIDPPPHAGYRENKPFFFRAGGG